jgi:hypothetical protein
MRAPWLKAARCGEWNAKNFGNFLLNRRLGGLFNTGALKAGGGAAEMLCIAGLVVFFAVRSGVRGFFRSAVADRFLSPRIVLWWEVFTVSDSTRGRS